MATKQNNPKPKTVNIPKVSWRGKSVEELTVPEIRAARKLVVLGCKASFTDAMLTDFVALSFDDIKKLIKTDDASREAFETRTGALDMRSRINISESVHKGDIATSKWVLEHTSKDFAQKNQNEVSVTIGDKEQALSEYLKRYE